jgi:hypothetical protein
LPGIRLKKNPYLFLLPAPPAPRCPLACLNCWRASPQRTNPRPRQRPTAPRVENGQKFANTCQHFLCQNAVFMRREHFPENSELALYSCGFSSDLRRLSKTAKQDSIPGRVAMIYPTIKHCWVFQTNDIGRIKAADPEFFLDGLEVGTRTRDSIVNSINPVAF